jgi:hypothetical protein
LWPDADLKIGRCADKSKDSRHFHKISSYHPKSYDFVPIMWSLAEKLLGHMAGGTDNYGLCNFCTWTDGSFQERLAMRRLPA